MPLSLFCSLCMLKYQRVTCARICCHSPTDVINKYTYGHRSVRTCATRLSHADMQHEWQTYRRSWKIKIRDEERSLYFPPPCHVPCHVDHQWPTLARVAGKLTSMIQRKTKWNPKDEHVLAETTITLVWILCCAELEHPVTEWKKHSSGNFRPFSDRTPDELIGLIGSMEGTWHACQPVIKAERKRRKGRRKSWKNVWTTEVCSGVDYNTGEQSISQRFMTRIIRSSWLQMRCQFF